MLPKKLSGFFPQLSTEIKIQESVAGREFYLQSNQVNVERKGKVFPVRGPGDEVPLERREGEKQRLSDGS